MNNCNQEISDFMVLSKEEHKIAQSISNLYKVLSEAKRVKIVLALSKCKLCVHQIVSIVGAEQSLVSHQLKILRDANLVKAERRGNEVVYSLADEHVSKLLSTAEDHVCEGDV